MMILPEINRDVTLKPYTRCKDFKRFLGVLEYISKNEIIIQSGQLKMRADLECLNLTFNELTFYGRTFQRQKA